MSYASSTQFQFWRFTTASLAQARAARHAASAALVASGAAAHAAPAAAPGTKRPRAEAAAAPLAPYLTLTEEETLLAWSALVMLRLARTAGLDRAVVCTALVFLRRFYLTGRLAEFPPDEMMCVGGVCAGGRACGLGVLLLRGGVGAHPT